MANHQRKRLLGGLLLVTLLLPASFILYLKYFAKGHEQALTRPPANLAGFLRQERTSLGYQVQTYFAGTELEVKVHFLWGKEGGPILAIFGGIHGDEAAGYLTAERYTNLKIKKGTLIIVPRLNQPAIQRKKRYGLGGDMNRLFHLPENQKLTPDARVVDLAKSMIKRADYVLNLHQADGFYSPTWISQKRNPLKFGQSNVIDVPTFDLPNGQRIELKKFAQEVAHRANSRIQDPHYHFLVFNTNTVNKKTHHAEQRKSLTYYALSEQHKISLGLESTKNCSLPQAVSFLTTVVNSVIEQVGIEIEQLPQENALIVTQLLRGERKL
jgi:hypothetical protein